VDSIRLDGKGKIHSIVEDEEGPRLVCKRPELEREREEVARGEVFVSKLDAGRACLEGQGNDLHHTSRMRDPRVSNDDEAEASGIQGGHLC
jgi:hypothetical protein